MSSTQPTIAITSSISPIIKGQTQSTTTPVINPGTLGSVTKLSGNVSNISATISSILYNKTQKSINELIYNGTGYYIDEEDEPGLTDLHTLLLACFATLVILAVTVSTAYGIRLLWKKYIGSKQNSQYDGILRREGTSESISRPLHSHLLDDKLASTDTHLSVNTEELDVTNDTEINAQVRSNSHSNTNGSIITMTLKNNHLIVETEERNDLEEDSRETTMRYSPNTKDGVFVVEVQQGMRRSPGSTRVEPELSASISDQCALVHNPPDKYSDEETLEEYDDSEYYIETVSPNTETPDSLSSKAKTGLAQSNTSLSHPSYCYANQTGYDVNGYGCGVLFAGVAVRNENSEDREVDDVVPKITGAVYKGGLKRSPSTEDLHLASIEGGRSGSSLENPVS
ncbi:unnamed protein product [Phyllotreta striolata]|uniref:Uncharacterized protein n=1 Tax=Phyllotreta striolata TaxID=444603 RepID=A0A9N9TTS3_PHYSR|nr:unnamed protein product [Phyllotreta striolata]